MTDQETIWKDDVLKRKPYAEFLTALLVNQEKSYVLNLDAPWGAGKTFFLERWREQIRNVYPTVYINAWETDFSDDPLLSVISGIQDDVTGFINSVENGKRKFSDHLSSAGRFLKAVAPSIAKGVAAKAIGKDGVDELTEIVLEDEKSITEVVGKATEELLKNHKDTQNSIHKFKEELSALAKTILQNSELSGPLFIFIDELDRCRPTYAIEMLERIKHLFGVPEIVFVIATDTQQLSHSIKAIYGENFESQVYLKRFFDQTYTLPDPEIIDFARLLFNDFSVKATFFSYQISHTGQYSRFHSPSNADGGRRDKHTLTCDGFEHYELILVFVLLSDLFNLDLRSQKQCFEKFNSILNCTPQEEVVHSAFLLFLIMFQFKDSVNYQNYFIEDAERRFEIIDSFRQSYCNVCIFGEFLNAKGMISIYTELLEATKGTLMNRNNQRSSDQLNIRYDIEDSLYYGNIDLTEYKKKVDLAGALS